MYYFFKICCFCLQSNVQLKLLTKMPHFRTTHIEFIKILIGEELFSELGHVLSICKDCTRQIEETHSFWRSSVNNCEVLTKCLRQIHTSAKDFGHIQIQINDFMCSTDPEIMIYKDEFDMNKICAAESNVADAGIKVENDLECIQELSGNDGDTTMNKTLVEDNCQYENQRNSAEEKEFKIEIYDDFEAMYCHSKQETTEEEIEKFPMESIEETKEPIPDNSKAYERENNKCHLTRQISQTGGKKHKCESCGKSYRRKSLLTSHLLTHTGEKPYTCAVCKKSFSQKKYLISHMSIHTGVKPYKCDVCGKSCSRKQHLVSHMLTHTGEKPHKCDICKKSFAQKTTLSKHILLHTGQKPHKCEICAKSFIQSATLTKHMLIHSGAKQHKCEICGKFFSQKHHLTSHMLIHTGEKAHKCEICGRRFAHKSYLTNHKLLHTGEKPHECEICGKSFTQKSALNGHMFTHSS